MEVPDRAGPITNLWQAHCNGVEMMGWWVGGWVGRRMESVDDLRVSTIYQQQHGMGGSKHSAAGRAGTAHPPTHQR